MTRLELMKAQMMGRPVAQARSMPAPAPKPTSAAQMIVALRKALAVERQARLATEARLRRVLSEIGRQPAAQPTRAAPPPPAVVMRALPPRSAAHEIIDVTPDMVEEEVDSVKDAIYRIGRDYEDEGEE